jgi:hypothetical protein
VCEETHLGRKLKAVSRWPVMFSPNVIPSLLLSQRYSTLSPASPTYPLRCPQGSTALGCQTLFLLFDIPIDITTKQTIGRDKGGGGPCARVSRVVRVPFSRTLVFVFLLEPHGCLCGWIIVPFSPFSAAVRTVYCAAQVQQKGHSA